MRESISESFSIQLVAAFILLFIAFLCLMISYYKCFKTKNEVITIIEKYQGYTYESQAIIGSYMRNSNYKGKGKCPDTTTAATEIKYKGYNIDVNGTTECKDGDKCSYCLSLENDPDNYLVNYNIVMFYTFDIPAFGSIASFEIKGKTVDMAKNKAKTILK